MTRLVAKSTPSTQVFAQRWGAAHAGNHIKCALWSPQLTATEKKKSLSRFKQNRRRDIAEATRRVLAREGYAQLSARKVAAEAGLSLGHITYNFSGMDDVLAEAYRVTSEQLREASMRSLETAANDPMARLEAFLRAGFTDEFLDFHHLRMRIDLWSAACNSEVLAETERVLYDHYRQTLRELMVPLTDGSPEKAKNIPALLDSVMATQDGLWLDWLRRRNRGAVENGLRMCMNLVRSALSC